MAGKHPRTLWNAPGTIRIGHEGLCIELDSLTHALLAELSVDHNDYYKVCFMNGDLEVGQTVVEQVECYGLRTDTISISRLAADQGYDAVEVYPWKGDGLYSLGHFRFLSDSTAIAPQ